MNIKRFTLATLAVLCFGVAFLYVQIIDLNQEIANLKFELHDSRAGSYADLIDITEQLNKNTLQIINLSEKINTNFEAQLGINSVFKDWLKEHEEVLSLNQQTLLLIVETIGTTQIQRQREQRWQKSLPKKTVGQ